MVQDIQSRMAVLMMPRILDGQSQFSDVDIANRNGENTQIRPFHEWACQGVLVEPSTEDGNLRLCRKLESTPVPSEVSLMFSSETRRDDSFSMPASHT